MTAPRKGEPVGLGAMVAAGGRALSEFTGTVLGLFAVQALMALGAGLAIAQLLASQFGLRPILDEAVDGDLVSLVEVLLGAPELITAAEGLVVGAVVAWIVLSWFLTGGLLAVLTERPRGRRETARTFGAGGAGTFFAFLRLGIATAILHLTLSLPALLLGAGAALPGLEDALTTGEVVLGLALALVPALLVAVVITTVGDYARAELTLRRPSHDSLGALAAMARAVVFVARRPVALGHAFLGWLALAAVSVIYAWAAHGHPMLGTGGAISILVLRQLLSLLRMAMKVGVIAGQVELGATRPPPPRQVVDGQ